MKKKTKILFVCLGNICRSPAAEGIMQKLVNKENLDNNISVDSAGILNYHEGELPDRRMRNHAEKRGYNLTSHSRPVQIADFYQFDLIIAMDDSNFDNLLEMAPDLETKQKVHRMAEYLQRYMNDYIPDPYYSGADGFELVLDLLEDACSGLLKEIKTASPPDN
ncbi:MAG: low molecular weight phosphotyrosine protein phosphatase [Bacteroidales bacterium]|nr:low molecular weight phosphotyrosine protein phosphatase [Bacteroidales bacterium]